MFQITAFMEHLEQMEQNKKQMFQRLINSISFIYKGWNKWNKIFTIVQNGLKSKKLIKTNHILNICKQIKHEESMIKELTISDSYALFREHEIRLGYLYNELMNNVVEYNICEIKKDRINLNNHNLK